MIPTFLAFAALIGIIVGLRAGRGGRPLDNDYPLPRAWWLLPFGLGPQILWTSLLSHVLSGWGGAVGVAAWLLPLSYLPIVALLLANARLAWARVILLGVLLNLAVSLFNGGTMPARLPSTGDPAIRSSVLTTHLAPGTKDRVIADTAPISLAPLADRYVITLPGGAQRLISVGDVVALLGGGLALLSFTERRQQSV